MPPPRPCRARLPTITEPPIVSEASPPPPRFAIPPPPDIVPETEFSDTDELVIVADASPPNAPTAMPPPTPAVFFVTWLRSSDRTPLPGTPKSADAMPPPRPWLVSLLGALLPVIRLPLIVASPWLKSPSASAFERLIPADGAGRHRQEAAARDTAATKGGRRVAADHADRDRQRPTDGRVARPVAARDAAPALGTVSADEAGVQDRRAVVIQDPPSAVNGDVVRHLCRVQPQRAVLHRPRRAARDAAPGTVARRVARETRLSVTCR